MGEVGFDALQEIAKDPEGLTLIIPLHVKYGVKKKAKRGIRKKKFSEKEIRAWIEFMNQQSITN